MINGSSNSQQGASCFSSYVKNALDSAPTHQIPEEDINPQLNSDADEFEESDDLARSFDMSRLLPTEQAKLKSCIVDVQSVVGDSFSDNYIANILVKCNFNIDQTIDTLTASPRNSDKTSKLFFTINNSTNSQNNEIDRPPGFDGDFTISVGFPNDASKRVLNFENLQIGNSKTASNKTQAKQSQPEKSTALTTIASKSSERTKTDSESSGPVHYNSQLSNFTPQVSKDSFKDSSANTLYEEPVLDEKTKALLLEETKKSTLSVVVIGHVDAGKSTLVGHLLYKIGYVTK